MKRSQTSKNLLKAVVCSLVMQGGGVALAADQPIEHSDGGTYNYNDTVNIETTSDSSTGASIWVTANSQVNFAKDVNLNLNTSNWKDSPFNGVIFSSSTVNIAGDVNMKIDATGGTLLNFKSVLGIGSADADGRINIQGNLNMDINANKGPIRGAAGYIAVQGKSNININVSGDTSTIFGYGDFFDRRMLTRLVIDGGEHNINITVNQLNHGNSIFMNGIHSLTKGAEIRNDAVVNISIKNNNANTFSDNIKGVLGRDLNFADAKKLNIKLDLQKNSTYQAGISDLYSYKETPAGIYAGDVEKVILPSTYVEVSGTSIWDVADAYGAKLGIGSIVGIASLGTIEADKDVTVLVTSERGVAIRADDFAYSKADINFNGDTTIVTNKGYALMSESVVGVGDYSYRYDYIAATQGNEPSNININKNGGSLVRIVGDLDHRSLRDSNFTVNLDTDESFLTGSSMKTNSAGFDYNGIHYSPVGTTDITLANGATWNMTGKSVNNISGDSLVDTLTLSNKGFLNMTPDGQTYENLTAGNLAGEDGRILMNTDLQQSFDNKDVMADSDRLIIRESSQGTHTIDIKDASLLTHIPSEGYLLLVEDQSQGNANFVGGELQKGGIFKYKPLITNEDPDIGSGYINSPANSSNWYLTGFEKGGIKDEVFINSGLAESRYIAYINEQDTLIKRLGELRQNDSEKGLWARVRGSNSGVDGFGMSRNSYVSTHLGYDWKLKDKQDAKRYMGVAFNHTNNNFDYAMGTSGKGQSNVLTVYGTELGDKGHYLDLVGKIGRMSNDYKYQGQTVSAKNWFYSLSAEYGRSIVKENGWYYEPQVQFTFGRVNGASYSGNGINVAADAVTSAILRAGVLVGRKFNEDKQEKMGSYYAKAFYNYEFGGNVKAGMTDVYGDRFDFSHSYKGGWVTFGLGSSLNLNKKTNIYLDVEKAFGGKVNGGWAWQGGVRLKF